LTEQQERHCAHLYLAQAQFPLKMATTIELPMGQWQWCLLLFGSVPVVEVTRHGPRCDLVAVGVTLIEKYGKTKAASRLPGFHPLPRSRRLLPLLRTNRACIKDILQTSQSTTEQCLKARDKPNNKDKNKPHPTQSNEATTLLHNLQVE
jgi:hypothetical protein